MKQIPYGSNPIEGNKLNNAEFLQDPILYSGRGANFVSPVSVEVGDLLATATDVWKDGVKSVKYDNDFEVTSSDKMNLIPEYGDGWACYKVTVSRVSK